MIETIKGWTGLKKKTGIGISKSLNPLVLRPSFFSSLVYLYSFPWIKRGPGSRPLKIFFTTTKYLTLPSSEGGLKSEKKAYGSTGSHGGIDTEIARV